MVVNEKLRNRLRKLLDERVPEGDPSESNFTDDELDELLEESDSVFAAASLGWTMKASLVQGEMGGIESLTLGQESEKLVSLRDRVDFALRMADRYKNMAQAKHGTGFILKIEKPEVI